MNPSLSSRRRSQRGAEALEATMTFLLFFSFLFLIIDLSLAVHAQAVLQQAVEIGARAAAPGDLGTDAKGNPYTSVAARVADQVAANSFGLLTAATAPCKLTIQFYDQQAGQNVTTLTLGHKTILSVTLNDYTYTPVGPVGHAPDKLHIKATAATVVGCPFSGCATAFDTPWPPATCH